MRLPLALSLCLALTGVAACQLALPGKLGAGKSGDAAAAAASPITGGAIATTSLDAPDAAGAGISDAAQTAPAKAMTAPAAKTASEPAAEQPATQPVPEPVPEPAPAPVIKSPAQIACEKHKGVWSSDLSSKVSFCQTPTKDGGKLCKASTDCQGYCLAKSNTCAPVTPVFGCQDILNEYGRMLTQCIN